MRITCDVIQDLMPSYVDGILSEDSQALVKEHMEACKECRKMLEIMKEEQSADSSSGSYPETHRCGSRLQPLVFRRKIHDPGKQRNVRKK